MDGSDMLDVIHVLYEDDITPRWEQDIEVKDKIRAQLYRLLYQTEYKYGGNETEGFGSGEIPEMPTDSDLPPEQMPTKEFIPATDPADFEAVLGEKPMGY